MKKPGIKISSLVALTSLFSALTLSGPASAAKPLTSTISLKTSTQTVGEAAGTITITVTTVPAQPKSAIDVPFTVSGTASNPADHEVPTSGVIVIPAGSTTGTATFKIIDDTAFENSETLTVTLGTPVARFGAKAIFGAIRSQLITLADNDIAPTVQFSTAKQSINEATGTVTATLQLSAASGKATTVPYTVSGTATQPADHSLVAGAITVPPGSTTANITFNLTDDGVYEGDETVILTLGTPTNANLGTNAAHTVTVLDSSAAPSGQWALSTQSVLEDAGKVTLNLKLSGASTAAAVFPFTVSGTAAAPGDHDLVAGSITVPAGATSANLVFNVVDDTAVELDETVVVTLGAPTGALLGATSVHTVTLKNNDVILLPVVKWSAAFQTLNENIGVVTATATINTLSSTAITVPFIVAGTAARPADHDLANGTITIPAGSLMGSTSFSVSDDTLYELDETIILSMGAPSGATLGTPAVQTVTLTNNDLAPVLSFSAAAQSVSEGAGTVTVTASLDQASGLAASAAITVGGTATNPSDHSLSNTSVTIPAGATSQTITFAVVEDTLFEGAETVSLTLGSPSGALLGATALHTVTITDNDLAPVVRFTAASQTVEEGIGTATIQVELDKASAKATSIPYTVSGTATNPGDHNLASGTLTIPAGLRNANLSVAIIADAVTEPNETIIVNLGTPTGGTLGTPATHTLMITDTVLNPSVQWMLGSQVVSESAGTVTVTAVLNAPGTAAVTAPFTLTGSANSPTDHNLTNGSITIPAGSTTASASFTIVNDTLDENDETVILTMGTPTGGTLGTTKVHTVTVLDDDLAPVAQFATASETLTEAAGTTSASVTLSAASGKAVTLPFIVSGTATNPADHNLASGSITIPAGSLSGAVSWNIVDDTLVEPSETIVLTLSGAPTNATLGAATVHTKTITDNETASILQWTLASQNASEAIGTVTVQASLSAALSVSTTVPFTVSGTATSVTDHNALSGSLTIPAGSLTANASFQLVNDTAFEGDETVILTLGNPSPSTLNLGARTVHTVTIKDDETAPIVGFTLASQSVSEAVGSASVILTLNAASASTVTVPYTLSGTATNPADHTLAAGSVSFTAGITSRTISVPVVNDAVTEANETLVISLGTPTGATLGTTTTHTLTIIDNDALPVVQWSLASQAASEAAGAVTLTATLSAAGATTITVPVTAAAGSTALATSDYTLSSNTITFPVGSTSASYSVSIVNDTLNENGEIVTLNLGSPVGATLGAMTSHALTITDNDAAPTIQWTLAAQNGDENTGSVTAVATLSAASGKDITVSYSASGNANAGGRTKYVLAPGTLTLPAGTASKNLPITLVNDNLPGPSDFYLGLALATPVNATLGAITNTIITLIDNDAAALMTEEGFRVTVWPVTRARCIGCHGASSFLPNHASDTLTIGHDAAKALVNFLDIPNSRMVLKSADGHCGANCMDNGTATATKPLMIAAITAWKPYLTMAAPSPTPSSAPPALAMTATAGIKDAQQYLEFLAGSVGYTSAKYAYAAPYTFTDVKDRLSSTGDPTAITQTMLLAYSSLASKVCSDFVAAEKLLAASSRQAFGPIDFANTSTIGTVVLSQTNINTVTTNLARIFWKRDPTTEEKTALYALVTETIAGMVLTTTDTSRIMTTTCTAIASSLDSISN